MHRPLPPVSRYSQIPLSSEAFKPITSHRGDSSSFSASQSIEKPHEKTPLISSKGQSFGSSSPSDVIPSQQKDLQPKKSFFEKYFGCFTKQKEEDEEGFYGGYDNFTNKQLEEVIKPKNPSIMDSYQNPKPKS